MYNHSGDSILVLDTSHHWAISSWHFEKKCCDLILQGWNVQEENLHTIIIFSINLSCLRYKLRIHVSTYHVHLSNYVWHWMNVLHINTECSKKKVLLSSHSGTMNMRLLSKLMGLSIPFYTDQYRWFWWQYKLSFTVYRKHCNRDAMIRNSVYNTTWSQVESPFLVLWQSLWLCVSCPLTSTWYGLLTVTGTTTRSGWIKNKK